MPVFGHKGHHLHACQQSSSRMKIIHAVLGHCTWYSMKTNALIIVSQASTGPQTWSLLRQQHYRRPRKQLSTVEFMVRCNLPGTGVNTGQSTFIMIMCTVLEPELGTATWFLLSQCTSWVSPVHWYPYLKVGIECVCLGKIRHYSPLTQAHSSSMGLQTPSSC